MHQMSANVVFFSTPIPKIYAEVMAFICIGPTMLTESDSKRAPLFVRRNKVAEALEWLRLNHVYYNAEGTGI
jgi:hypothetical protein